MRREAWVVIAVTLTVVSFYCLMGVLQAAAFEGFGWSRERASYNANFWGSLCILTLACGVYCAYRAIRFKR